MKITVDGSLCKHLYCLNVVKNHFCLYSHNLSKYKIIHLIKASLGKQFLADIYYNCTNFFLNKKTLEVKVDRNKVKKEMEHLTKYDVIIYFIDGR